MTNASRPPVPPPPPPPPPRVAPPPPPPVAGRPPSPPPIGNNEQTLPINMAPPRVAPPPAPTASPPRVAPPPPAANTVTTPAPPSTVVQSGPPSAPVVAQVVAPPAKRKPSPGQPTMIDIVKRADEEGCSDIHLGVNEVPRFRKRGDIVPLDYPTTDLDTFMSWLGEIMSEEDIAFFQENLDYDGAADLGFVRIRISCFDSLAGPAMVLRLIGATILV